MDREWAFWRRTQYVTGFTVFLTILITFVYYTEYYEPANCFDLEHNADERGIDCGGDCVRICSFDVMQPTDVWARSFRVTEGQYNAVAYIENKNLNAGTPGLQYTFSLYDAEGLIAERSGTTLLPPDSVYPIFEGRIMTGERIPTLTRIELEEAEMWVPAEMGRDQFIVEDRQLRNTDSRPRLDASITNTEITEAQDVEIVSTIFDIRGNALTSSRTIVPNFMGRSTQDVVFTWPEPIAKTIRSCEVPTDVVIAVDLSGSMNNDGGDPPEPISSVLGAARAFVDRLNEDDQIGVVTYATEGAVEQILTKDKATASDIVRDLSIAPEEEVGSTNTGDAIVLTAEEINSSRHNANARKVLVLLTDGLANEPEPEPEQFAINAANALKETGVDIFTIGLGNDVNETFLKEIASDDGHYFKAGSADTVDQIYRSVTAAICEDGAAVIEIIPKTGASFESLQ